MILIVAGVAGSGKTTVGALLAGRLGWRFADADTFHSEANVAKMRAGIPLTDADREPWLRAITGWMDDDRGAGSPGWSPAPRSGAPTVTSCSPDGPRRRWSSSR